MNRTIVMIDWTKPVTRTSEGGGGERGADVGVERDELIDVGSRPAPVPNRATAASSRRGMAWKPSVPSRNRATATSSAAISAAEARGPIRPASRAIRNAGKRASSGARNSSRPVAMRSGGAAGDGRRSG